MFKKIIASIVMVGMLASPALAQLSLNYTTFSTGQTISAAQFTENFTNISNKALNRTGGVMTGTLTLNGGTDVNGSFTIGSTNLQPFDSTGMIKEISSTYFASLSAANLTGVLETSITDGSLLARVASPETISAVYTFTATPVLSNVAPILTFTQTDGATNEKNWQFVSDSTIFELRAYNDALNSYTNPLTFTRSGTTVTAATLAATAIGLTGNTSVTGTLGITGVTAVPAGTVGAPSIVNSTYTNTGVYFDTDRLCLAVTGTSVFCVDDSLGIIPTGSMKWSGNFLPNVTGTWSLGNTSLRWSEAWVTAGAFNSSDRRMKKNIVPTALGIEFIDKLKPVEYNWINPKLPQGKYYGFIAQDLQALGFAGVDSSNPKELGLRYTDLIAPLVKATQEIHAELHIAIEVIKIQQDQIDVLNERLNKLSQTRRQVE